MFGRLVRVLEVEAIPPEVRVRCAGWRGQHVRVGAERCPCERSRDAGDACLQRRIQHRLDSVLARQRGGVRHVSPPTRRRGGAAIILRPLHRERRL